MQSDQEAELNRMIRFLDRLYVNVGVDFDQVKQDWRSVLPKENEDADVNWSTSLDDMLEAIVAAEMYCIEYSAKEQPHAQGLLHTLHDSM
eukprot:5096371-Karenia_brevis.AAC.1